MADQNFVLAPRTVNISFEVNPVLNALDLLMILSSHDRDMSGFSEWSTRAAASLTPEQRYRNEQLISLFKALETDQLWPSFTAYLDSLATVDAVELRDRSMEWMCSAEKAALADMQPLSRDELLADLDVFLNFHRRLQASWAKEETKEETAFDTAYHTELFHLLNDPPATRDLLLGHLRDMWDTLLAEDWKRTEPMLRESVEAFQQIAYTGLTALEAIRIVTERDLSGIWGDQFTRTTHLIFVPSAHIGPYVRLFGGGEVSRLIFGARLPEGTRRESLALNRSELLVRLGALADDTRLQILELLTKHQEMCAQDIMTALELSQSSTSRHLRQLTATGYLIERRREVAKCYSLNPARFEDTMQALQGFLTRKPNL